MGGPACSSVPAVRERPFFGGRLRLARQLRGLSQAALARELAVSEAAISQFERDHVRPAPENLARMSMMLKVHPSFFARDPVLDSAGAPFFRALSRTPARERHRGRAFALLVAEIGQALDDYVEMPTLNVEQLISADAATPMPAIEAAAARARELWGVREGPVPDVVNAAEANGVFVAAVGDFDQRMDAFTLRTTGRPVVVLCTSKGIAARRRFDMAHELGHLVLHRGPLADARLQETQAHRFAAAFLMPPEEVERYLPRRPHDLESLEAVARTWGVSMQAALYRARQLAVMSESHYTRAIRLLSAAGWRRREPIEIGPPERPSVLARAVAALPQAGVSLAELAERVGLPEGRLRRMLSVPEDRDDAGATIVQMRPVEMARRA